MCSSAKRENTIFHHVFGEISLEHPLTLEHQTNTQTPTGTRATNSCLWRPRRHEGFLDDLLELRLNELNDVDFLRLDDVSRGKLQVEIQG